MKTYLPHTLTALLLFTLCCLPVHAQNITLDGTTGPHPGQIQPLTGPNYTIDATQGTTLGSNLYHGFQTFNLFQNESATFTGPADIRNVVNRVTGGPSSIDGLLQSTMPNANFYFLNPNGVFFGPQASVNVPNSFYVSTSANPQIGEAGALVAAGPAGFQGMPLLTGERAERFGLLEVTGDDSSKFDGQPLGLEGDTVNIHDARLSVVSVDVKGKDSINIQNAKIGSEGKVLLQSRKVLLDKSTFRVTPTSTDLNEVNMEAEETLDIRDSSITATDTGVGNAPTSIILKANDLTMINTRITSPKFSSTSAAGVTKITATNKATLDASNIDVETSGPGPAGNVILNAKEISLQGGSQISLPCVQHLFLYVKTRYPWHDFLVK